MPYSNLVTDAEGESMFPHTLDNDDVASQEFEPDFLHKDASRISRRELPVSHQPGQRMNPNRSRPRVEGRPMMEEGALRVAERQEQRNRGLEEFVDPQCEHILLKAIY